MMALTLVSGVVLKSVPAEAKKVVRTSDHTIPWPWGAEMPFPWTFVQGIWLAENDTFKSYFTFRVVRSKPGSINQLEVQEVDPATCEIIARGVGFEENRVVRAQMIARHGNVYRLALRSFSTQSIPRQPAGAKPVNGQYVVLSVLPMDSSASISVPMTQISKTLGFKCQGR